MAPALGDGLSELFLRIQAGDPTAEQQLVTLLYEDLRAIAARRMRHERPDHSWQPTVLVHEVLLRLRADGSLTAATSRPFLLRAASKAMHQLLIDHHRHRSAQKRGGRGHKHPFDRALDHLASVDQVPLIDLSDELDQLARVDSRASMVVHFRFFLGMDNAEVAEALGVSQKTVERDWRVARAWLRERLKPADIP